MFKLEEGIPGLGSLGGSRIVIDQDRVDQLHDALSTQKQTLDQQAKTGKSGGTIRDHQHTPNTTITRKTLHHSPATPKVISNASKKSSNYRSRPNGGNK